MGAVEIRREGEILVLTIDRPKANAIDSATSRALGEAFVGFRDDPALRVAIITGAGDRFFSAGWDLKAAAAGDPEDFGPGGFAGLTELFDLDKPVIAAVNGFAAGGGFELALACDLVVAVETARFSLPEVRRGFVADAGGVLRLPKRLPRALAMEMLLTGQPIDAAEAARRGLVNCVVAPGEALGAATELAERILGDARKRAQMGQAAALIHDVPSVAEVIEELFQGGPEHARHVARSLERFERRDSER